MIPALNECYGYAAAFVSVIAFGSFAVPIKCRAARKTNVDPLVLQTYKIVATLLTCWLVLLIDGVEFSFTPWGFVSGLFMVPGGTAGYYAVQNAGLATSQGISCSLKVIVAFAWGLLVFSEPVLSETGTLASIAFMVVGLVGMSYFSSKDNNSCSCGGGGNVTTTTFSFSEQDPLPMETPLLLGAGADDEESSATSANSSYNSINNTSNTPTPTTDASIVSLDLDDGNDVDNDDNDEVETTDLLLMEDARSKHRQIWGMLGAVIDGAYGGSVMVPLHYAGEHAKGLEFLISFAIGCSTVLSIVWFLHFSVYAIQTESMSRGWAQLPSLHISTVGPYAALAGFIWAIGNVSCILSVDILGQGVGYSIVQSQLLIAGLWGVFFYKEIKDPQHVTRWFFSAFITVCGIVLLSQEHIPLARMAEEEKF